MARNKKTRKNRKNFVKKKNTRKRKYNLQGGDKGVDRPTTTGINKALFNRMKFKHNVNFKRISLKKGIGNLKQRTRKALSGLINKFKNEKSLLGNRVKSICQQDTPIDKHSRAKSVAVANYLMKVRDQSAKNPDKTFEEVLLMIDNENQKNTKSLRKKYVIL